MGNETIYGLVFVACTLLCCLLSGMETGVFGLSRWRIRRQMKAGSRTARLLHGYLEKPEGFLWTILVGNTLATFMVFCLLVTGLYHWFGTSKLFFFLSLLVAIFVFYTFCDLLPKTLFGAYPNRLSMAAAIPFRFVHLALSPLVKVIEWFSKTLLHWTGGKAFGGHVLGSRNELRMVMQESAAGLSSEERSMIDRVLNLQSVTVRQIMTLFQKLPYVTTQTTMQAVIQASRAAPEPFLPVWHEEHGGRRIVGILSLRGILYSEETRLEAPAGDLIKPALYLGEDVRLEEALRRMQRGGQQAAIVLGFDRREIGMVSMLEIIKVIFGEIRL